MSCIDLETRFFMETINLLYVKQNTRSSEDWKMHAQ
jgi:hypothetical protein